MSTPLASPRRHSVAGSIGRAMSRLLHNPSQLVWGKIDCSFRRRSGGSEVRATQSIVVTVTIPHRSPVRERPPDPTRHRPQALRNGPDEGEARWPM